MDSKSVHPISIISILLPYLEFQWIILLRVIRLSKIAKLNGENDLYKSKMKLKDSVHMYSLYLL